MHEDSLEIPKVNPCYVFICITVFVGSNTVKILYVIHPPLSFSSSMIGYFLAVSMLYRGIGVIGGMPFFTHYLKLQDYTLVIIGCFTTYFMFIALAFSTKLWMVFVVPLIDLFGGIAVPCIRSMFSKIVGKEEKGAVFSAIASIEVLCSVVASVLFNNVYSKTVDWHPGFCFFIMSAVLAVPIMLSWYLKRKDATFQYKEFTSEKETHDVASTEGPQSINSVQENAVQT